MEYKSIEDEAADCRAAFAGVPVGSVVWCLHHRILCERFTEPIENRISFVRSNKDVAEQAIRYREMRPVNDQAAALVLLAERDAVNAKWQPERAAVNAKVETLHRAECPDSVWDGKTLFPVQP
jgi:hypothetical protein